MAMQLARKREGKSIEVDLSEEQLEHYAHKLRKKPPLRSYRAVKTLSKSWED